VDIDTEMTGFKALPPGIHAATDGVLRTRLQQVMSKESGDWWIVSYHNIDVKVSYSSASAIQTVRARRLRSYWTGTVAT
jgi:hypothetical protein